MSPLQDELIPVKHASVLYERCSAEAKCLEIIEGPHNPLPPTHPPTHQHTHACPNLPPPNTHTSRRWGAGTCARMLASVAQWHWHMRAYVLTDRLTTTTF